MFPWFRVPLLVCLMGMVSSHFSSAATLIELHERVTLPTQTMIQLKDIATLSGSSADETASLGEILLTPAPAPGRSVRLTFDDVRGRLLAKGVNLTEVEFRGQQLIEIRVNAAQDSIIAARAEIPVERPTPMKTQIQRTASPAEEKRVNESLVAAFRRAFRTTALEAQGWDVRCELLPRDVGDLVGISSDQLKFRQGSVQPGVTQTLTVWWSLEDGSLREIPVNITLDAVPVVLAMRHALPAGAILRPDDLEWVKEDNNSGGMGRVADAIGKQTTRMLRPGQVLKPEDVTEVTLVRSNDIVTVWVRFGGVKVRRPFKAMSSGGMDETVNLVALDDPRLRIQARVTGYHEASLSADQQEPRIVFQVGDREIPLAPSASTPATGGLR